MFRTFSLGEGHKLSSCGQMAEMLFQQGSGLTNLGRHPGAIRKTGASAGEGGTEGGITGRPEVLQGQGFERYFGKQRKELMKSRQ